jgi:hypothetical protein
MSKKEKPAQLTPLQMQLITEKIMRELGANITMALNEYFPGSGFALLVFPFNNPGISNYISNAERSSMITALKESVRRLEQNEDIPAVPESVTPGSVH